MTRERRSLWGSISTSNKVNRLSLKAALLYTWSIPWEDDEGFQEADLRILKNKIVPFRDDIPLEEMKGLFIEIVTIHQKINDSVPLWKVFHKNSTVFIWNPVHQDRQTYHGIKKIQSKIKQLIIDTPETVFTYTKDGVALHQDGRTSEVKLSEVKLSEGKGSKEGKPFFLSIFKEERKSEPTSIKSTLDQEVERIKKIEQEKGHYL